MKITNQMDKTFKNSPVWVICRICLKNVGDMINIYENEESEPLNEQIQRMGDIQINFADNLPNTICKKCLLLLRLSIKFRNLCKRSEQHFQSLNQGVIKQAEEAIDIEEVINIKETEEIFEYAIVEDEASVDFQVVEEQDQYIDIDQDSVEYLQEEEEMKNEHGNIQYIEKVCIKDDNELKVIDNQIIEDDIIGEDEISQEFVYTVEKFDVETEDDEGKTIIENTEVEDSEENQMFTKAGKRKTINDSGNSYICAVCGNTYKGRYRLKAHMKIHTLDKPHECEICLKRFAETPQLKRHMNSHTGNRPYKCKYCTSSFADPSTCIKHERIHTKERPYRCHICSKAFSYSNVLKVHLQMHSGEKPYSCSFCQKTFTQAHHKNSHERRHIRNL